MKIKKMGPTLIRVGKTFVSGGVVLAFVNLITAQQPPSDDIRNVPPRGCEFNTADLNLASVRAGKDSVMILIGRSGSSDSNAIITTRRLHTAKAFLTGYTGLRTSETVITAQVVPDEKQVRYGGIEVYVNGSFVEFLTAEPDKDLLIGYCSGEKPSPSEREKLRRIYPWRYKNK